ncbi:MAG TPA: septum formation initiator family protein [Bacteroidales bacterium]|jgi:cell division protein FtsB|nr:septum formation initiator family protein [Bacteroidales bacterium]HOL74331.1 septum formation initiator family protein [Bacteroidales bacterium]HPU47305.1 septum formation initiator family protein [Bacteroidales bacterium]HPZ35963.1 septum formation initiator family protein [Bacteroidales bacterium]HQD34711.1 septum formation initiator family protein [Bacteroidales bacterium]
MTWKDLLRQLDKYKYILVLIIFLVFIIFLDNNNLIKLRKYKKELNTAKEQNEYYKQKIKEDSLEIQKLKRDKEQLELYARKTFFFKKDNETIFLIVKDSTQKENTKK